MNASPQVPESLIWATRGRSWGFQFLLNGGLRDPLAEYERAFAEVAGEPVAWHRQSDRCALRLTDPLGRRDTAGRVIPHDFVLFGDLADRIQSVEDGLEQIWPIVADAYSLIWDKPEPPSHADLRFDT